MDWLKSIAPTLATAFGGPLAGAAVAFLGDFFGIKDANIEKVQDALNGISPQDRFKLVELDNAFKTQLLDAGVKIDQAQAEINLEEAKSNSTFKSGWRPFIGWNCGLGISYNFIVGPLLSQIIQVWYPTYAFKPLDIEQLLGLVATMLGVGTWRTIEKIKDKS